MAEQHQSSALDVGSPTLEALYNDLDMYINELSVSSRTGTPTETTFPKRCNKDITPLNLDKTLVKKKKDKHSFIFLSGLTFFFSLPFRMNKIMILRPIITRQKTMKENTEKTALVIHPY